MTRGLNRFCWRAIAAGGLAFAFALPARAILVELDLYVTYSILNNTGAAPLADGSWVEVVGSADINNDGMATWGGTNYIANSVQGNDVLLGYVYIGENSFANVGKFFQTFTYNTTSNIGFVYIRYFQTSTEPVGMIHWGQSDVYNLSPTNYGVVAIDVAPLTSLVATDFNNFVVIPEPATGVLVFLAGGALVALRMKTKAKQKKLGAVMRTRCG